MAPFARYRERFDTWLASRNSRLEAADMSISVTGHGKFAKQTGGRGQYGHVVVRVTVNDANAGMMVVHQQGAAIPEQFVPAVENGIRSFIAQSNDFTFMIDE